MGAYQFKGMTKGSGDKVPVGCVAQVIDAVHGEFGEEKSSKLIKELSKITNFEGTKCYVGQKEQYFGTGLGARHGYEYNMVFYKTDGALCTYLFIHHESETIVIPDDIQKKVVNFLQSLSMDITKDAIICLFKP